MHKVGDLVAVVRFCKVNSVDDTNKVVNVKDINDGLDFNIRGEDMLKTLLSANSHTSQEKKTMTELATIVSQSFNKPMTVNFIKQDKTERTMVGRVTSSEPLLGRSYMEDSEETKAHKIKQVDHRTINWVIVDGVKYVLKK